MRGQEAQINDRHHRYIAERTAGDDAFLQDLKLAAIAADIPEIWIGAAQASLIQILLKLCRAKHVVELGTLVGYSAIWMARGLPAQGRVSTIELLDEHADFAEAWISQSDVADKITLYRGDALAVLQQMDDRSADACFIDADKENYSVYLDQMRRILMPGSLVLADNAFAFGELFEAQPTDPGTPYIRAFNDYMAAQDWLHGSIVAVGDGMWVGVVDEVSAE